MRIFVACLASETNTFSPLSTTLADFEASGIRRGADSTANPGLVLTMIGGVRDVAQSAGHEVVEGLCAVAPPLGIVERVAYETLRDELVEGVVDAGAIGAVVLLLHGAMVAEGYDDCEGDLIERVRRVVGPGVPIGVVLDPHCHFTRRMRRGADVLVAFKQYPHVDTRERAADVCRLVIDMIGGRIRPVTHVVDCRMVGLWHTTTEPMRSFVAEMVAAERRPHVLSVSFAHGFPWGDVPEAGAKVWVISDDDADLAASIAESLAARLRSIRDAGRPPRVTIAGAIARVAASRDRASPRAKPIVMADPADNPGGGAAGDSTFILEAMLACEPIKVAIGCLHDPDNVARCFDAGTGASLHLAIGGRHGAVSHRPIEVDVAVVACARNHAQTVFGTSMTMGDAAWVRARGRIDLVLVGRREQVVGLDAFTGLGIDLSSYDAIVVKSAQHFHAAFAPIAREVLYVDTPGLLSTDFARLPYLRRDLDYWPRVAEPGLPEAA